MPNHWISTRRTSRTPLLNEFRSRHGRLERREPWPFRKNGQGKNRDKLDLLRKSGMSPSAVPSFSVWFGLARRFAGAARRRRSAAHPFLLPHLGHTFPQGERI